MTKMQVHFIDKVKLGKGKFLYAAANMIAKIFKLKLKGNFLYAHLKKLKVS
jgi:hypothetical protein